MLSALFFDHTYSVGMLLRYSLSDELAKYALVYLPTGLLCLRRPAPLVEAPRRTETPPPPSEARQTLVVGSGRHTTVVPAEAIVSISAANPYVTIHTHDKKYLYSASLKSIHQQLDPAQFVRIHKSAIVNLAHVTSYTSRLNGDYDVRLKNGQLIRLSRTYAASFNQHLAQFSASRAAKSSG
ncbi:transcriptional regulator, LytTR family [Hymenobacter roseosalivarius DSM 11622]|uniref:Transcriptional regulator, LytTR family n=2 Tax=Hymenobacter roseosalivarius TaxID=89967 RepID=A0A1W1W534_9BACT|nr:transcriptional regulator, LytTR family [Hymenobacter roseosalivarius DSM 11622]